MPGLICTYCGFDNVATRGACLMCLNLLAVTDATALQEWVDQVVAERTQIVAQVRAGDKKAKKAFGFLMGRIMMASAGKAPPAEVKKLLERRIRDG